AVVGERILEPREEEEREAEQAVGGEAPVPPIRLHHEVPDAPHPQREEGDLHRPQRDQHPVGDRGRARVDGREVRARDPLDDHEALEGEDQRADSGPDPDRQRAASLPDDRDRALLANDRFSAEWHAFHPAPPYCPLENWSTVSLPGGGTPGGTTTLPR